MSAAEGTDHLPYLAVPPKGVGRPVLIVHSWWGLTTSFTNYADRLAAQGFVAGCADLFQGGLAATEAEAHSLRRSRRPEPMYRTLQSGVTTLGGHPRADGSPPAVIGFSMGGHWAVWLAQHPPPEISGVVLYYAARSGDFDACTTPFLAHFAGHDDFVSRRARREMQRQIASRGLALAGHDYPDTTHWFAESDRPEYDQAAAEVAFGRTLRFLAELDDVVGTQSANSSS